MNATQTDRSFNKFLFWLKDSQYIRDIDLSCTVLRTSNVGWPKLIEVVKEHNALRSLNLSHNKLLENQNHKLTEKEIEKGLQFAPWSKYNQKFMDQFLEMLEMN